MPGSSKVKTLDAEWATEADLVRGQDFVAVLDLVLAGGTERLASRAGVSVGGQAYQPLLASVGPVGVSHEPLLHGRLTTSRCAVAVDNRKRFGGPSTRWSAKLTGTEPEGARFALYLARTADTADKQLVLAGRVLSASPLGDVVELQLGDDLAWLEQTQGVSVVGGSDYPYARNVLWFSPNVSDVGKGIPVRYGELLQDQPALWAVQRVDWLRSDLIFSATEIEVFKPEIWNVGGGTGWLMRRGNALQLERFLYTGVDKLNRKLTGVTRGHLGIGPNSYTASLNIIVLPSLDDDFDPANIVYQGQVGTNAYSAGTLIRKASWVAVLWSKTPTIPVDIKVNGSTVHKGALDDDGTLRLFSLFGTGADNVDDHLFHRLEYMWYSDVNDRTHPNLFDFLDSTFYSFGNLAAAGQWSVVGVGTNHDSGVAGEMEAPYNTTWDDKLQGRFRLSGSKTQSVSRDKFWESDHPGEFGIEFQWRVATQGTRPVTTCQLQLHGTGRSTLTLETATNHHWKQFQNVSIATAPVGVIQTTILNLSGIATNVLFGGDFAAPWIDWVFGIDYGGAGTDYVVDFLGIRRIWCRGSPKSVVVAMDAGGDDVATADVEGARDDGAGTFTGTPNVLIANPADVRRHFVQVGGGLDVANIDVPAFVADRARYSAESAFSGSTNSPKDFGPTLAEMDFAARAWTYCSEGKVRSRYRESVATLQATAVTKALTRAELAALGAPAKGGAEIEQLGFRVRYVERPSTSTLAPIRRKQVTGLVGYSNPPVVAPRIGANELGNAPAANFDPVLDPTVYVSPSRMTGSKDGDLPVVSATNRLIASSGSSSSQAAFGSRRAEILPDIPWLTNVSIANAVVAALNEWREAPRMVLRGVSCYLDQYELEPGDLVTLSWPDDDGGSLYPQLDGSKRFLVLPTPAVAAPAGTIGRVELALIQVDM